MKNIKTLITVTGCLLLMLAACKQEFLQVTPAGPVSEQTLENAEGVNGLLIGAYSLLDGGGAPGGGTTSWWHALAATDDAKQGSEMGVTILDAFLYDATTTQFNSRWSFLYAAVQRCNDVIRLTPRATDATAAQKTQFLAEARFLRGVYYLYLGMGWKNVPWIDETITYGDKNYLVANENIYPHVEADFKFAADNLTPTKTDVGRANKWAAKAFLAKTYMHQDKFAEAKPLLEEIIANGVTSSGEKYKLLAKYGDNFKTATRNGTEAVFAIQMSVNDGANGENGNPSDRYNGPYNSAATSCCGWFQPSFDLVDAHQTDSVSGLPLPDNYINTPIKNDQGINSNVPFAPHTGTLDPRLDWSVGRRGIPMLDWGVHPGKAWVRSQLTSGPYTAKKNLVWQAAAATDKQGGGNLFNTPYNMIRFADVLLWAAECEVEVGSLTKAEEYVNLVRARAANPAGFVTTYTNNANPTAGFTTTPAANYKVGLYSGQFAANGKSYARKAVRFERRIEFAMEHHRQFDMRRYDGTEFDMEATVNSFLQREQRPGFNTNSNYKTGRFVKGKNELYPIPQRQIDLSVKPDGASALKQNPGW
jgi:starch-binding outer membrane protein, SusD/RagB family